ncbi:MAG: Type II secretion system F domain-containing protein [Microgenomates group bacterium GW2011_GWF1_38_5]|nr:MAG: Type II secretion system F domain-containing protein [Microgenomates group bacterium GW2011_GWF1_38_5]
MNNTAHNKRISVPFQERILFTKHLSTMYKAGIPLPEIIQTLILQTKLEAFKKALKHVLAEIENGQPLSKALSHYPKIFDQFYVSLIQISEESGTLEDNLDFLAVQMSKDYSLRKKVKAALLYPGIVLSSMLILGTFLGIFILPKLVDFFESFDIELPVTTKILLFIAKTMESHGILIIILTVVFIALFRFVVQIPKIKFYWHTVLIKLPVVGILVSYSQVARFARNLGTLVKSGIPIVKSLEITSQTLSNLKYQKDLYEIAGTLNKGKLIGVSMENKKYWEFPAIVSKMISVGEKSGKLDEVLLYLSEFYDDEIDDLSKNLSTILEPILLVIMGLGVGFVALSIITPIYELTGSIRK